MVGMMRRHGTADSRGLLISFKSEQGHIPHDRRVYRNERIERTDLPRALKRFKPAIRPTAACQRVTKPRVAERKTWIKLDRLGKVSHGRFGAPSPRVTKTEDKMSPMILVVEHKGPFGSFQCLVGQFTD